ncbi:MAG: methyltransferase domain-containing protein [Aeromonadales bacterium]|nr:methyltransferase domain-containing protein [Aeromonadales bacterium]
MAARPKSLSSSSTISSTKPLSTTSATTTSSTAATPGLRTGALASSSGSTVNSFSSARPATPLSSARPATTGAGALNTQRSSTFTTTPRTSTLGSAASLNTARPTGTITAAKTAPLSNTSSTLSTARNSTFTSTSTRTVASSLNTSRPATSTLNTARSATTSVATAAKTSLSNINSINNSIIHTLASDGSEKVSSLNANQEVTDVQYRRFAAFVEDKCGIVLGAGKQYLVNSRLSPLLSKFKLQTVDDLINKAMEEVPNNRIQEEVIDAMTTNETLWFRDTYPYLALENIILPELAKKAKYPVRIWSAACSSGQEPYSIAMVVQEQLSKMLHIDPKQTQIIGTDLSPEMLSICRRGQYDAHALSRGLSPERKSKFFKPTHNENLMQIDHRVKSMVEFRPMNLLGSYALMGRFDVIFCRNVLIYFSNEVKAEILRKLTMCLNPGGYLILGSTETLVGVANKYDMIRANPGIIYHLKPQRYAFE